MQTTLQQLGKALRNPKRALSFLSENPQAIVEELVTPFRARYLFDTSDPWDLVIILDACRYDLGVEASHKNEWLPAPEAVWSPGAHSQEWMRRTFGEVDDDVLAETVYVSANQFTDAVLNKEKLAACDEVWRYAWDDDLGCVPPRPVTDRAISAMREDQGSRYIVHYMQPHLPPVAPSTDDTTGLGMSFDGEWTQGNPWRRVERGEIDSSVVERAYRENMTEVIEEVRLLLNNVNADNVVVTADHGNFLGEGGEWGHQRTNRLAKAVREVPWWELSATDKQTHEPATYGTERERDTDELLRALGYR